MLLNGRRLVGWRSAATCAECRARGRTLLPSEDLDYRGSGLRPVYVLEGDSIVVMMYLCPTDWELWALWVRYGKGGL